MLVFCASEDQVDEIYMLKFKEYLQKNGVRSCRLFSNKKGVKRRLLTHFYIEVSEEEADLARNIGRKYGKLDWIDKNEKRRPHNYFAVANVEVTDDLSLAIETLLDYLGAKISSEDLKDIKLSLQNNEELTEVFSKIIMSPAFIKKISIEMSTVVEIEKLSDNKFRIGMQSSHDQKYVVNRLGNFLAEHDFAFFTKVEILDFDVNVDRNFSPVAGISLENNNVNITLLHKIADTLRKEIGIANVRKAEDTVSLIIDNNPDILKRCSDIKMMPAFICQGTDPDKMSMYLLLRELESKELEHVYMVSYGDQWIIYVNEKDLSHLQEYGIDYNKRNNFAVDWIDSNGIVHKNNEDQYAIYTILPERVRKVS